MEFLFKENIFQRTISNFPQTRYQGSKNKLLGWINENISFLDFETVLDAFGGTGAVSYLFKTIGKTITYNDILKSNYFIGTALIENNHEILSGSDLESSLSEKNLDYSDFIQKQFHQIYFTEAENKWLDITIQNIYDEFHDNIYKKSLALWCLFQACIIKRPFNLFHRKNLYMRTNDVDRSFGNKTTWDKPFEYYFKKFSIEANQAIFDNGKKCKAIQLDALKIPNHYDLVYIDTPYVSKKGVGVDYRHFYHFLEGLARYDEWDQLIDYKKKHLPLKSAYNPWCDKNSITDSFNALFSHFRKSHLVISYRSDGIPAVDNLIKMIKSYKKHCKLFVYKNYQYVLSTNNNSHEILLIAWD
ncbi:DNA methyltransferase [candidate division KSB1 bacterium]|nr:DNA methyltransferase [candidate division KSB1 bacterium]